MSNEPRRSKVHAQRDLNFIRALREADAFNGYFLRRLKDRRATIEESFHNDGPVIVDAVNREAQRQILQQYEWIIEDMMAEDETSCRQVLTSSNPTAPGQGNQGQPGMG